MNFDPEEFLKRKYYATDVVVTVSDVSDFLEFSERNIDWQFKSECQTLRRRATIEDIPSDYYDHLLENVTHRFTVSLPTRVRYSALVALTTAVDWSTKFLKASANFALANAPPRTNTGLHILRCFNEKTSMGQDTTLNNYANLVTIRTAIVHSGGVKPEGKKFGADLLSAVKALRGFCIDHLPWLGECVTIERGALEPYVTEMAELIPALYRAADEKGLFLASR
jgi:hypothetical protein